MRQAIVLSPVESSFDRDEERSNEEFDMFWKELIPEGVWKHPIKGFTLNVDKVRLDKWAATSKKMSEREIRVPVPHGHRYTSNINAGFVVEQEVRKKENGKHALFGLLSIPKGEDSKGIGKTVKDVSVSINPNVKHSTDDGKVEELGEAVEHAALTNYPVITGMQDFVAYDQVGDTVAVAHLDLIDDTPSKDDLEGYILSQGQLEDYAKETARAALAALGVSNKSSGGKNMKPEQLRALEQKFGLDENSLTEENWFETVNDVKLVEEKTDEELVKEKAALAAEKATLEKETKEFEAKKKELEGKGDKKPEFEIGKAPEFQQLQEQNKTLLLDLNQRRLADASRRLDIALKSGRINKAAFDKIIAKEEQLQFSQDTCTGDEWNGWIAGVEMQLSVIEQLPEGHTVSTERQTGGHMSNELSHQLSEDDEMALDKEADAAVKSAVGQYHEDNVKMDKTTGLFVTVD